MRASCQPDARAVLLVGHGERLADARNVALQSHVAELRLRLPQALVRAGLLAGEPCLEDALDELRQRRVLHLVICPCFMSAGYFANRVLPDRVARGAFRGNVRLLPPLGLVERFPLFVMERAISAARGAGVSAADARLIVAGHGSRRSQDSAEATEAIARRIRAMGVFRSVGTAYLEQPTFLSDELAALAGVGIVAGLFAGEGLHGSKDVPAAIETSGARAIYTGPLGVDPAVVDVIAAELERALGEIVMHCR